MDRKLVPKEPCCFLYFSEPRSVAGGAELHHQTFTLGTSKIPTVSQIRVQRLPSRLRILWIAQNIMITDLLVQASLQSRPTNVFELFLGLYQLVAEAGLSGFERGWCEEFVPTTQCCTWHHHDHPLARSVADIVRENPNPLDRGISSYPKQTSFAPSASERGDHHPIGNPRAGGSLYRGGVAPTRSDHRKDSVLPDCETQLSFASSERSVYVVRKPRTNFYSLYRAKEQLPAPSPLQHGEFEQALGLISTYVAPPLVGGQHFAWTVNRVSEPIDSVWRSQAQNEISFILLSFPHDPHEMAIDFLDHKFLVRSHGPNEPHIQERGLEQLPSASRTEYRSFFFQSSPRVMH
jgi:hypothetical protein